MAASDELTEALRKTEEQYDAAITRLQANKKHYGDILRQQIEAIAKWVAEDVAA